MAQNNRGILVTGGGSFLGDHIAAALLAEGAAVSLLVRPGIEDQLGSLSQQTSWSTADVWNPASLRGKARHQALVIHALGSARDDPARGLSYDRLNLISARNVANMCVSDGVERLLFISCVYAPWLSRGYRRSKRKAEAYVLRVGLRASVIRAPLLYAPDQPRPLFFRGLSLFSRMPPIRWLPPNRLGPMPIDLFARGIARIALDDAPHKQLYFPRDLRRHANERSQPPEDAQSDPLNDTQPMSSVP